MATTEEITRMIHNTFNEASTKFGEKFDLIQINRLAEDYAICGIMIEDDGGTKAMLAEMDKNLKPTNNCMWANVYMFDLDLVRTCTLLAENRIRYSDEFIKVTSEYDAPNGRKSFNMLFESKNIALKHIREIREKHTNVRVKITRLYKNDEPSEEECLDILSARVE